VEETFRLPEAAAVIDGHPIPMKDVEAVCMASFGPPMATVFVQNYVVDRECERRGIKISDAEIDRRVAELSKNIAPMTIEEGLKQHHTTMDGLRHDFRQEIQRTKLAIEHVKPTKFVHARVIFIKFRPPGMPVGNTEVRRTDAEARALITKIQTQVKAGTSFAHLAKQYSEMDGTKDGDVVLYEGIRDIDTAIVNAALNMRKGEIGSGPGEAHEGYFLIECLSTDNDHEDGESAAYDEAESVYREQRAQSLIQDIITDLIKKSHVVYYVHS
jgi:foldase protein PrsA